MSKNKEIVFPERVAKIEEIGKVQSFQTREGETMYGIEVVMDNGDCYSFWALDRLKIEMFKEGVSMIYRIKKTIENEGTDQQKIKVRLDTYDFILPRKVRAEQDITKKLIDSISFSVTHAKDILVANPQLYETAKGMDMAKFGKALSNIANEIHQCTKAMLLAEDFGDA